MHIHIVKLLCMCFVIITQVGLAVGDTQEERAKAQLTKISLQVFLIVISTA